MSRLIDPPVPFPMRQMPVHSENFDMKSVRWGRGGVASLLRTGSFKIASLTRANSETCQEMFAYNFEYSTGCGSGTVVSSRLFQYSRARGVVLFAARVSVIYIPVSLTPTNAHTVTLPNVVTSPIYSHILYPYGSWSVMKPTPRSAFIWHLRDIRSQQLSTMVSLPINISI